MIEKYSHLFVSYKSYVKEKRRRPLELTALGRVLLEASNLATAMSTHRDRALLQRYAHSDGGNMSYRQPFVRQDPQTNGLHNDDILYRATGHARMLMSGDLCLWVLDENTILTCLAPRIGEDADFGSRDLQGQIHQVLSDQLFNGLECTVDNIMTVILEVCFDTMFNGLAKDSPDIDLIGVVESEIASLVRERSCYYPHLIP